MQLTIKQAIDEYLSTIPKIPKEEAAKTTRLIEALYLPLKDSKGKIVNTEYDRLDADMPVKGNEQLIRDTAIDIIIKMQRKDNREYMIYNQFFDYLNHKQRSNRNKKYIEALPKQFSPLERMLSITKDMHQETFDIETLERKYMVNRRTIEDDLKNLKYGVSVMDQKLQVNYSRTNKKCNMISTVHPLFLTQNLTQIVCMLEGLRTVSENRLLSSYAMPTAISIWMQLSEYAKNRILNVLTDLMHLDQAWYEEINSQAQRMQQRMFLNEIDCFDVQDKRMKAGGILYAFKAGIPCIITYQKDNKETSDTGKCYVKNYEEEYIEIETIAKEQLRIAIDSITEVEVEAEFR